MKRTIAVLGAGSWGVTLADLLFKNGHAVTLWEISSILAQQLAGKRQLTVLPNVILSHKITVTDNIASACIRSEIIVVAVPSLYMRSTIQLLASSGIPLKKKSFVSVTKGLENKSFLRMSQVIADAAPITRGNICALSGPSHAEEVSRGIPTAIVAASTSKQSAELTQNIFMNKYFRVYTNSDIAGVELGGALKNILAIACGIGDGLGLGDNTKAALMTRGLAEMTRLGIMLKARPETFAGLSGIGDLVVTCTSRHSRNRLFGEKIGRGKSMERALQEMVMVAEGIPTTKAVHDLARKLKIDLPITSQVYAVLYKRKNPKKAIAELMTRKARSE